MIIDSAIYTLNTEVVIKIIILIIRAFKTTTISRYWILLRALPTCLGSWINIMPKRTKFTHFSDFIPDTSCWTNDTSFSIIVRLFIWALTSLILIDLSYGTNFTSSWADVPPFIIFIALDTWNTSIIWIIIWAFTSIRSRIIVLPNWTYLTLMSWYIEETSINARNASQSSWNGSLVRAGITFLSCYIENRSSRTWRTCTFCLIEIG